MPVVLLPLHFDREPYSTKVYIESYKMIHAKRIIVLYIKVTSCQRSIVLRPFISKDFMTGVAAIPGNHIPVETVNQIADEISKVNE